MIFGLNAKICQLLWLSPPTPKGTTASAPFWEFTLTPFPNPQGLGPLYSHSPD